VVSPDHAERHDSGRHADDDLRADDDGQAYDVPVYDDQPDDLPPPVAPPPAGRTMIYSTAGRMAEPLEERARARSHTALLLMGGRRLVVGPAGVTLGRSRQCDVMVDDPNVSRTHAEVRPRGGSWVLSDLGSTNGSRLNGHRLDGPEVLKAGDEIELGTTVLTFVLE
jgi:hypothetical protein